MEIRDLGLIRYRDAWAIQEQCHAQALAGGEESLLLLEHPPVITFGRRADDSASHLLASADQLAEMGVEIVASDRGGDITFHGPGQLVAYPVVRLADRRLSVAGYVHRLEEIIIQTLADFGIAAFADPHAPGVWVPEPPAKPALIRPDTPAASPPAKICALGVRIRRGISLHGIALNLTTDLRYFHLINPCGLSRPVTTMQNILGQAAPTMPQLKQKLAQRMEELLRAGAGPWQGHDCHPFPTDPPREPGSV